MKKWILGLIAQVEISAQVAEDVGHLLLALNLFMNLNVAWLALSEMAVYLSLRLGACWGAFHDGPIACLGILVRQRSSVNVASVRSPVKKRAD